MSGWQTVYLDTVNETNARDLAAQLGSGLQPGQISAGDENYCFLAYSALAGHDDVTWSFPVLARFNTDLPAGLAACNAVLATSYVRAPANPSNVWAS
ncbi:MAG: hypothetical protein ACM3II_06480 [Rhodospirillaceae bacterium]